MSRRHEPSAWLASARVHLAAVENTSLDVRLRCFHGQRAVELAVKGLLLLHGVEVPKVHSLARLMLLLPDGIPAVARRAAGLTAYAVEEMYPDTFTELDSGHAEEAVELARAVVEWAASIIESDA